MCGGFLSDQVLAEISCIPDRLIPQRPEAIHIMVEEYLDHSYGKEEEPPDWWKDEFISSNW